jgi:hypothetical protein
MQTCTHTISYRKLLLDDGRCRTERQIDRQTDRQLDRQTDRQLDRQTDWQIKQ